MPILAATAASAAATVSYASPILISASSIVLGTLGGYYFQKKRKTRERLHSLLEERLRSQRVRDEAITHLADTTTRNIEEIRAHTQNVKQQIVNSSNTLEEETNTTRVTNTQLQEIALLLDQVGEALDEDTQRLILELKNRLFEFSLTHEKIVITRDELARTVEELQESVTNLATTQKNLENNTLQDKSLIQSLSRQLSSVVSELERFRVNGNKNCELKTAEKIITAQNRRISALQGQNVELREKLRLLTSEPESKIEDNTNRISSPRPVTMFR